MYKSDLTKSSPVKSLFCSHQLFDKTALLGQKHDSSPNRRTTASSLRLQIQYAESALYRTLWEKTKYRRKTSSTAKLLAKIVQTVNCRPAVIHEIQLTQHSDIFEEDSERLSQEHCNEFELSYKYYAYHEQ